MTKSNIEDLHLRIVGTSFGTLRSESTYFKPDFNK